MKSLPKVKTHKSKYSCDMDNSNFLKENFNPFKSQMEKVIEVKIYLNFNFHKNDIDDSFINDLEQEYAIQYLEKMRFLPSKQNITKILKLRPIEQCDFHLSIDHIHNKQTKIIHIYPNNKSEIKGREKLQLLLSNDAFETVIQKNIQRTNKDDTLIQIKRREIKKEELALFNREGVDNMFSKARDDILDKKLYSETKGINDKDALTIDNIREKYLNPNNRNILESVMDEKMNARAKFQNIDKAKKRDILTDERYAFQYLDVQLGKDVLDEVTQPMEVPVEIIMKDINFILDYFPIDELVDLEENDPIKDAKGKKNVNSRKQLYYKIKSVTKEDIIYVYKKIQSPKVYRLIGLTVNLLYWIVFGYVNRKQIDKSTKQYLFFKLLQSIQELDYGFYPKKLYNKIFMPLLILIVRIECENIFSNKFKLLFASKVSKESAMEKVNELITVIFDPHCYYNTFTIIGGNTAILKHKLSKKIQPKYKSKTYITSNLVDQLFTKFKSTRNMLLHVDKGIDEKEEFFDFEEWEREKNYIADSKMMFFRVVFNKINQNLKKRNLDPIFSVRKEEGKKMKTMGEFYNSNNNKQL